MEGRKEIAKKKMVASGILLGGHMVNDVKEMGIRWDKIIQPFINADDEKTIAFEDKTKVLSELLQKELLQFTPKRIKSYIYREENKVVDKAIDIFSNKVREITNSFMVVPVSAGEGLLREYNIDLKNGSDKVSCSLPKGIRAYYDNLFVKRDRILNTWRDIEIEKIQASRDAYLNEDSMMKESDIFVAALNNTLYSRLQKKFKISCGKLNEGKYNLRKYMSVEEFNEFTFECLVGPFLDGVLTKYNEVSIGSIFPFHLSRALLFNGEGEINREEISKRERKNFEKIADPIVDRLNHIKKLFG